MQLQITPISAFNDNYIWMLRLPGSPEVAVVDPGDAEVVLNSLREQQASLRYILITHKHHDHIGGVEELVEQTSARVYAPQELQLIDADVFLGDGDSFRLFDLQWQVFAIPGHTLEHIMYYCPELSVAFVGDTLFAAGCGRIFEGTPEQMYKSLSTIMSLPEETMIYPAHEYTLANLRFALEHDPNNKALQQRYQKVEAWRADNKPSLPARLAEEKATNPFCRTRQLRSTIEKRSGSKLIHDWQVFAWLRKAKDMA